MAEPNTYYIEHASSGRAKCKKCKEAIAKGELRIATNSFKEGQDIKFTSYNHPKCFQVPPRAMKGVSPEDFVNDHLEDHTDDSILDDETKRAEIVAAIAYRPPRASKGGKKDGGGGEEDNSPMGKRLAKIKAAMEKLPDEDEDSDGEERRPAKKAKKSAGDELETCARAMKIYGKMKNEDLKSVIRWNLGYGTTGTKDILLLRCIDGHVNGRLGRCPTCFKGKLNLKEEDAGATIICKGYYDEDIAQRIPCGYATAVASAPRLQPWYSNEPTQEEIEAMKAITEKHEAVAGGKGGDGNVPPEMATAAGKIEDDWDSLRGKEKAQSIVDICTTGKTKADLPQDEKKARIAVGKLIMSNQDATALETLELVIKEFGVSSDKEEAKAKQKSAMASSCKVSANAGIVQAFQELGDYYFKDGNANAGLTYKKAITAITGLDYEITEDNAKGLGKGKTKLVGIGKGTADKIYEFCSTGTIQKLEEKRTLHS